MDKHFLRIDLIQSEHNFTLCRVVIDKFGFKERSRNGAHTLRKQAR